MVTLVVAINILLSLILLYIARLVLQIRQALAYVADRLTDYERATHTALYTAPESISAAQEQIYNLRQKQEGLKLQIRQMQQIIGIIVLARKIWQGSFNNGQQYPNRLGVVSEKLWYRKSGSSQVGLQK